MPSYYEALGVEADADQAEIKDAYVAAVRASAGRGPGTRKLDEAYAVVGHADRRRRYDDLRTAEGGRGNAELLALLAVIAETGGIPMAEDVLGPPAPDAITQPGQDAAVEVATEPPADQPDEARAAPEPAAADPPAPAATPPEPASGAERPSGGGQAATGRLPGDRSWVPGTDADVRQLGRRRTAVAVILAGIAAGVVLGLLYASSTGEAPQITADRCVQLTEERATAVDCSDAGADARITAIVDDAASCPPSPLGTLELDGGGSACLGPPPASAP